MEQTEDARLKEIILERIRARGRITFAEYMAACLYEPGLGYYTSPGRKVGAAGDFYTSSNVHGAFGRLIARELCRMWETMGSPAGFAIVEAGAGGGRLALDILDAIAEIAPQMYESLAYRLIEAEPTLKETQRLTLAKHLEKLVWNSPADLSEGRLRFTGCLLSNELIDAFPVHMVEMTADGLREVYVTEGGDGFAEFLDIPSAPELETYLMRLDISLDEGQRAEINLNALRWLESAAKALERGYLLTIDYGYQAAEMYGPMRRNGTLLCYFRHAIEEDPYIRPGLQDMTSHVDFTTLMERGEEFGLHKIWFGEQYRFLMACGLMEEMMAMEARAETDEERLKNRLAMKKLIMTDGGMGDTFRVLVQAKRVEAPQLLCMRDWGKIF